MRLLAISSNSVYEVPREEGRRKHLVVSNVGRFELRRESCLSACLVNPPYASTSHDTTPSSSREENEKRRRTTRTAAHPWSSDMHGTIAIGSTKIDREKVSHPPPLFFLPSQPDLGMVSRRVS